MSLNRCAQSIQSGGKTLVAALLFWHFLSNWRVAVQCVNRYESRMRVLQTFPTANDQETIAAPVQRRRRQSNFVRLLRGRKEGRKEVPQR